MAIQGIDLNDPGFKAIVEMFVSELPDRVAAIEQALVTSDTNQLRRISHQLKGAAGCYGFGEITGPAAELQLACDGGQKRALIAESANQLISVCRTAIENHETAAVS